MNRQKNMEEIIITTLGNNDFNTADLLFDHFDINHVFDNGENFLIKVINARNFEGLKYLVDKGIVIDAKDKEGESPLSHCITGSYDILNMMYLISHGADIYAKNNNGKSCKDIAHIFYNVNAINYLEYMENTTIIEWCNECELEVRIPKDKVSQCPCCGARILPCCMCDWDKINCSTDCPFDNK